MIMYLYRRFENGKKVSIQKGVGFLELHFIYWLKLGMLFMELVLGLINWLPIIFALGVIVITGVIGVFVELGKLILK